MRLFKKLKLSMLIVAISFISLVILPTVTAQSTGGWQGTASDNVKVYLDPSSTSRMVTILTRGVHVTILVEIEALGIQWCHVQLSGETEPLGYVNCIDIQRPAAQVSKAVQKQPIAIATPAPAVSAPIVLERRAEQPVPATGASISITSVAPMSVTSTDALTNSDIISMTKAGLPADVLVAKIKSSKSQFDTSPASLSQLKTSGVADGVILAMVQAPTDGTTNPPAVQAAAIVPTEPSPAPPAVISVPTTSIPVVQSFSASGPYKVTYDGGSLGKIKPGQGLKMYVEQGQVRLMDGKSEMAIIPASSITEISYGQDVHRRVGTAVAVGLVSFGVGALTVLSKSKKHFVGVTWADGDQKGGFAMQCDKNEYRGILAGLEGISGKKAINSENMNVKN
jgi:hypothetical protein